MIMDNGRMARELLSVAKTIVADAGDVEAYFNVSDFFKPEDGSRMFDRNQLSRARDFLETVISDRRNQLNDEVRKTLKRNLRPEALSGAGLVLK
jgi:hypothetical protein